MRARALLCVPLLVLAAGMARAEDATTTPAPAKPAGTHAKARHATTPAKLTMDPKAMEEMMAKMATPGPNHERFKKMEGNWDAVVKWFMDPSQPAQESASSSVFRTVMDGRYLQEEVTGTMMGKPFSGMGLTGYDNVLKKYVGSWIDNVGTGIMTSTGVPDAAGDAIHWTGQSSDPTTGKAAHFRMEEKFPDENHMTYEMYSKPPSGKEVKVMSIEYTRKM